MKTVVKKLNEAIARIDIAISIAGAIAAEDALPDTLCDWLSEASIDEIDACLGGLPEDLKEALDDRHERDTAFHYWALENNKLGFILSVETPDMSQSFFSWGSYRTQWVYGYTFEEAIEKALEWVASVRAEEEAEKAARKGGA